MKIKIVRKQLLNKLQQETDQDGMTKGEQVTNQDARNILLDYNCISFRKAMKAALYLH